MTKELFLSEFIHSFSAVAFSGVRLSVSLLYVKKSISPFALVIVVSLYERNEQIGHLSYFTLWRRAKLLHRNSQLFTLYTSLSTYIGCLRLL